MKFVRRFTITESPFLAAALNELAEAINERTPRKAPDYMLRERRDGFSLRFPRASRGGGGGAGAPLPFEILAAPAPAEEGDGENAPARVLVHEGTMLKSPSVTDALEITGLGEAFEVAAGDVIYLEVTFSEAGIPESAAVEHGAEWTGYPEAFSQTGATDARRQGRAFALLGYAIAVPEPNPHPGRVVTGRGTGRVQIVQCTSSHLRLVRECVGASNVLVLVPHMGARV